MWLFLHVSIQVSLFNVGSYTFHDLTKTDNNEVYVWCFCCFAVVVVVVAFTTVVAYVVGAFLLLLVLLIFLGFRCWSCCSWIS